MIHNYFHGKLTAFSEHEPFQSFAIAKLMALSIGKVMVKIP